MVDGLLRIKILSSIISLSPIVQVGINLAYSGVLIPQLANDIKGFTKEQASWIASLIMISQPIGALFIGPIMDYIGRKKAGIITNIPIVIGWIMIYFTEHSLWPIYVARILAGLSGGMSTVGGVYTAEITHALYRPMLLSLISVNTSLGILIATILGVYIEWHLAAIFYGLLALISLILTFFIPESPYWLANFSDAPSHIIKSQVEYLNRTEWLFDEEWAVIQGIIDERKKGVNQEESASNPSGFIKGFLERTSYLPLLILGVLFFLQQTSGTYVVIFYTVNIFKAIGGDFGMGFDEYNATTTLGVLRFIMSFVTLILSKNLGRRILLIISSACMAVSALAIAIFLKLNHIFTIPFEADNSTALLLSRSETATTNSDDSARTDTVIENYWILISVLIFVCASALGQMVIPWTMIGELLPTKILITLNLHRLQPDPEASAATPARRTPTSIDVWPQILSSVAAFSIVIQVGINMAYSGVLIPQLANDANIKDFTKDQASWIASLVVIFQPIGAFFIGPIMDYLGRKKACVITNIPTVMSWILIYFSKHSLWPIYLARVLAGLSGGMTTFGVVYTAEISHAQYRPMLLSLNSVNVAIGILLATILGVYMEWHTAAIFYGSLSLISLILSCLIPESPYWLANFTDASTKKVKTQVEYLNRPKWLFDEEWAVIQRIMDERKKGVNQEERASKSLGFFKGFCERTSYLPLLLLVILFLLQQISGTYVVIFYTVNIFKSIGGDFGNGFNEYNATTTLGVLRFIMSFITLVLSKKIGRRILLILSSSGMAVSALATAIFLKLNNISTVSFKSDNSTAALMESLNATSFGENALNTELAVESWWILISVLTFVVSAALGQMVVPWTMLGELLPTKVRASGSGLIVAYTSLLLFIVIKTLPYLIDFITLPFVFVSYSVLSILAIIFIYFYLPETFGKNFAEIANYFEKK
uniref:Major facilitator superfamily (MFS) profile domain-containing protein n=1 Tax=Rhodnius prolixus TaxID=13249 RepID=T1HDK1_RHOPR